MIKIGIGIFTVISPTNGYNSSVQAPLAEQEDGNINYRYVYGNKIVYAETDI